MNSMSDVVALKRIDMENIQRERRKSDVPELPPIVTPRLIAWNVNNTRPNTYYGNINRTFMTDVTYLPGADPVNRYHPNQKNRDGSWNYKHVSASTRDEEESDGEEGPTIADAMYVPEMQINPPLGLLRSEYKHPLSMYEEALNNMYSRNLSHGSGLNPIRPRQYYTMKPRRVTLYTERPIVAGKSWARSRESSKASKMKKVKGQPQESAIKNVNKLINDLSNSQIKINPPSTRRLTDGTTNTPRNRGVLSYPKTYPIHRKVI